MITNLNDLTDKQEEFFKDWMGIHAPEFLKGISSCDMQAVYEGGLY